MSAPLVAAVLGAVASVVAVGDAVRIGSGWRVRRRLGGGRPDPVAVVPSWLAVALSRAGIDDHRRALVRWSVAVGLGGVLAVLTPGGRLVLATVVLGPPVALRLAQGRRGRQRAAQLPDALDAVGAGLRAGLALAPAVEAAATVGPPLGPELAAIGAEVRAGRPLDVALARWSAGATDAATALAGAALGVAASVGGPGARAVDGAAASLRDRLAADAEAAALSTQATASAAVLTVAPVAFAVLLTSLDPTAARFLLGTPVGWTCIAVGLALDAAGAWWMAALVRRHR